MSTNSHGDTIRVYDEKANVQIDEAESECLVIAISDDPPEVMVKGRCHCGASERLSRVWQTRRLSKSCELRLPPGAVRG